jgi:hypothetical protein
MLLAEPPDDDPIIIGPGVPFTVAAMGDALEVAAAPRHATAGGVYHFELDMIEVYP